MISIIILSYNTKDLTVNCIESIFKYVKEDFEVIVVDNASTDGSVELVRGSRFSVHGDKLKVIENKENVGFAKGCNIGAKQAKGEFLLFLNSDTEFKESDVLSKLIQLFGREGLGIAGGLMINPDKTYQRSFGQFYTLGKVAKMLFSGESSELSTQNLDKVQETDWVSGGFMLVKKEVFEKVNGFDEGYFMYMEDVDICYRVKKNGYDVMVDPGARVRHIGQGSSNRTFAVVHIYKGLKRFYKTHLSSVEYIGLMILLYSKAFSVMLFGTIKSDQDLVKRYKTALSSL